MDHFTFLSLGIICKSNRTDARLCNLPNAVYVLPSWSGLCIGGGFLRDVTGGMAVPVGIEVWLGPACERSRGGGSAPCRERSAVMPPTVRGTGGGGIACLAQGARVEFETPL